MRRWMRRLASSTKSWNRLSSRLGAGSGICSLLGYRIEGEYEVAPVVGGLDPVGDGDSRLPARQRGTYLGRDLPGQGGIDGVEDQVVDTAAVLGTERPLTERGAEDQPDRFLDLLLTAGKRERARTVQVERERPAPAGEVAR